MRGKFLLSLLCSMPATAACAAREEPSGPRLVVLYAACTVNRDFLSPYAPAVRYTPNIQAFADGSLVFRPHVGEAGQSRIGVSRPVWTSTLSDDTRMGRSCTT